MKTRHWDSSEFKSEEEGERKEVVRVEIEYRLNEESTYSGEDCKRLPELELSEGERMGGGAAGSTGASGIGRAMQFWNPCDMVLKKEGRKE